MRDPEDLLVAASTRRFPRVLRIYAILAVLTMLVIAVVAATFFRHVSMNRSFEMAQLGNLQLARAVLEPIRSELIRYFDAQPVAGSGGGEAVHDLPSSIRHAISEIVKREAVVRLKIFDRHGAEVFSTLDYPDREKETTNDGVAVALGGAGHSVLNYRSALDILSTKTDKQNLVEIYIPIRASDQSPVVGVFEIYADANELVTQIERQVTFLLLGIGCVIACFYVAQAILMRRAANIIEAQHNALKDRSNALKIFSAELLREEDAKTRRIADTLHNGLAQTLNVIKLRLQNAPVHFTQRKEKDKPLESILPLLQDAIHEATNTAMELRPPILDELGLLPTIEWFCREFKASHQDVDLHCTFSTDESDIPAPLKVAIFRIVESALLNIARHAAPERLDIHLFTNARTIELSINETPRGLAYFSTIKEARASERQLHVLEARERTLLSGGVFSYEENAVGGMLLSSRWPTTADQLRAS